MPKVKRQWGSSSYEVLDALVDRVNALESAVSALTTLANEIKADFNVHTHRADGAQAGTYNTSKPQSDAQTLTPVTAVTVDAADAAFTSDQLTVV